MPIFHLIIVGIPLLTLAWWRWADGRLRAPGRRPGRLRAWRVALACFAAVILLGYGWFLAGRFDMIPTVVLPAAPPGWLIALVMLWGLIFLPLLALPLMGLWLGGRSAAGVLALLRRARQPRRGDSAADGLTRRQAMGAAVSSCVVTLPMLATLGSLGVSIPQKRRFRIREITVNLPQLPHALDGMTIAHLSDTHVGKFTRGPVLDRIVRRTNELRADLVLFTGDLIDYTVRDLAQALRMLERIDPGAGLGLIEGNHDLFDGRTAFEQGVRQAGFPLLLDQSRTVYVRGQAVQLLGVRWHHRGGDIAPHVRAVAAQREPGTFPILLAHHPHAFDHAVEHGIPLTLAGHTHGGQLMLTRGLGAGPAMFRYWSGLYEKGDGRLVVSNGAGNWFPLRTNAPAEILRLTLRRA